MNTPILYSFRRCPYCIRAHMALHYAGLPIELRAVELRALPDEARAVSPKATVPALDLGDGAYISESWDIVKWALQQFDPDNWLGVNACHLPAAEALVATNDGPLKHHLDRYKYADRYPEQAMEAYRLGCERFIQQLNTSLEQQPFLLAEQITVADIAVFPFIRQFAMVDPVWFEQSPYPAVQRWLARMLATEWFKAAFSKQPIWQPGSATRYL